MTWTGRPGSISRVSELRLPTATVRRSFVEAMDEFTAEGRGGPADDSMIAREMRDFGAAWHSEEGFADYVARVRAEADPATPRPTGWVSSTTWWLVEDDTYLGRIAVRHRLNDWLRDYGGHIGYDVRPSARRRGHATRMLVLVLPEARALGVDPALVTCDVDNIGSRTVIQSAGGVYEDERGGKLRFWVPTS